MAQYNIAGPMNVQTGIPRRVRGTTTRVNVRPVGQAFMNQRAQSCAPTTPWDDYIKLAKSAIQTPAQIQTSARQTAAADEAAALARQKAVSDQIISQYNNQAARAQGFARALGQLQAGEDQQAQARYQAAANTLTGIGTGLTGDVAQRYQEGVDATREMVNRVTGGLGQVSAPEAADLRNAGLVAGSTLPARSLAESAVNAANLAQADAAARRQNIALIGQAYTSKADEAIAQAASDARALVAQRPATIQQLVQQLTQNRQAGVTNLAGGLAQRASYQQAEQKRLDDLAQQAITNRQAWAQIETAKGYLQNQGRLQEAQITGRDPKTGELTYQAGQDQKKWQQQRARNALDWSNHNDYV